MSSNYTECFIHPAVSHSECLGAVAEIRLETDVMFALASKYGLALYEMIQKRGNLDRWALQPAMAEVDSLSDFGVKAWDTHGTHDFRETKRFDFNRSAR